MVYGLLTLPIHRRLTFEQAFAAFAMFCVLMYWLVRLKHRLVQRIEHPADLDDEAAVGLARR